MRIDKIAPAVKRGRPRGAASIEKSFKSKAAVAALLLGDIWATARPASALPQICPDTPDWTRQSEHCIGGFIEFDSWRVPVYYCKDAQAGTCPSRPVQTGMKISMYGDEAHPVKCYRSANGDWHLEGAHYVIDYVYDNTCR